MNAHWIAFTAIETLVEQGKLPKTMAAEAMKRYGIQADKPNPVTV